MNLDIEFIIDNIPDVHIYDFYWLYPITGWSANYTLNNFLIIYVLFLSLLSAIYFKFII